MPTNKADASYAKVLSGLGLCARARALTYGTAMVCEALRDRRPPYLVLEASDTSEATHKRLCDKCQFYQVELVRLPATGGELAEALGKQNMLAAVAVRDENLCRVVRRALSEMMGQTEQ
jgi:ribosomal protein L7Ae-like RNA K-turn-binding protein